jgi:hypothetical protein
MTALKATITKSLPRDAPRSTLAYDEKTPPSEVADKGGTLPDAVQVRTGQMSCTSTHFAAHPQTNYFLLTNRALHSHYEHAGKHGTLITNSLWQGLHMTNPSGPEA